MPSRERGNERDSGARGSPLELGDCHNRNMSGADTESVIEQLLERAAVINKRQGFMAWDLEKLALDPRGDPGPAYPRLRPPTQDAPRLFISYGWSRDESHDTFESDLWIDAFAGFLFGRGYDIVFDRDPRNFHKGLSWQALLVRMNDCNYFVPIISDAYIKRISAPNAVGAAVTEWNHALKAYPEWLTMIGIWHSGSTLLEPLTNANTVDIRDDPSPFGPKIAEMFPDAPTGSCAVPQLPAPERPPDPPGWPTYKPYD